MNMMKHKSSRMKGNSSQRFRFVVSCICVLAIAACPVILNAFMSPIQQANVEESSAHPASYETETPADTGSYVSKGKSQEMYKQSVEKLGKSETSVHLSDGVPEWFIEEICEPRDCEYVGFYDSGNIAGIVTKGDLQSVSSWFESEASKRGWGRVDSQANAGQMCFMKDGERFSWLSIQMNEVADCVCLVINFR